MYNQFPCSTAELLSGVSKNCEIQVGVARKLFFTDETFQFATQSAAQDSSAALVAGIVARTVYPLPYVEEFSNDSEDDTYFTGLSSVEYFVKEGKHSFTYKIKFEPGLHARLRTGLNGKVKRLLWTDSEKNLVGTSPDDTVMQGWLSGTIRVQKWEPSDGSNIAFTTIKFVAESTVETNDELAIVPITWNINGIEGVQPLQMTQVSGSATEYVVDIAGLDDGVAVEGITSESDFIYLKADGTTEEALTGVAESATVPGRYTFSAAAFTTGGTFGSRNVLTLGNSYYYLQTPIATTIS